MIDKKKLIEDLLDCVAEATDTETQITNLTIAEMLMIQVIDEALNVQEVAVTLPNEKSKEFIKWTKKRGFISRYNGLWYSKNGVDYDTKVLHRAFTNEIEFGN